MYAFFKFCTCQVMSTWPECEIVSDDNYQTVIDVSLATLMSPILITCACYGMENYDTYFKTLPGGIYGFFRKWK